MKPITVFIEVSFPPLWRPGYFSSGWFKRVWWLCFAVAWVRMELHEYNAHIAKNGSHWVE